MLQVLFIQNVRVTITQGINDKETIFRYAYNDVKGVGESVSDAIENAHVSIYFQKYQK
jgi:hypothetical protein